MVATGKRAPEALKNRKSVKRSIRLFQPATMVGYRRNHRLAQAHTSLLAIKDVHSPKDAAFYLGKRVCYVFKGIKKVAQTRSTQQGRYSRVRTIWGRITRAHGNSGAVRAKFQTNLPTHAIGRKVRVYLFPSTI